MGGGPAIRVESDERGGVDPLDEPLQGRRRRLEDQAERADAERPDPLGQHRRRRLERQARGRRAREIEAVRGASRGVQLDERERGGSVGRHDRVDADPVVLELAAGAEAVGRDAAEVRDRLLQASDRARDVVGAAARMADQCPVGCGDEIDECLAGNDERVRHARET